MDFDFNDTGIVCQVVVIFSCLVQCVVCKFEEGTSCSAQWRLKERGKISSCCIS